MDYKRVITMLKKTLLAVLCTVSFCVQAAIPVAKDAKIERITDQAKWSEGPIVLQDGTVVWSDIVNNRVLQWNEKEGVKTWLAPAQFQNGHAIDQEGRIVAASHGKRAIERLEADGSWRVLVDLYSDKKLNSPNDVIIDKDGDIWFTDPTFGIKKATEGYGGNAVVGGEFSYHFSPKTHELVRLNTPEVKTPNGIAFSPDGKKLYLTDSQVAHDQNDKSLHRHLFVYDIDETKQTKNGKMLAQINTGVPDGIAVDDQGNIWVTGGEYIHVFTPAGKVLGQLKFPTTVANMVFATDKKGQKVMYVAGGTSLYRLNVEVGGSK